MRQQLSAALSTALATISGPPLLVRLNPDSLRTDIITGAMEYNNPLPATWQKVALAAAGFSRTYALGTATPYSMHVDIRVDQEASAFAAAPVQPLVGPVQAPLMNTRGAFQTYFAEIQSWYQPGSDLATSPLKRSLPRGRASVLTGTFSP